jgi:hypothetical protein
MIKKKVTKRSGRIEVDLTGPEGNAYALLGYASRWCDQLGLNYQEISKEMTSGDYENLVQVLDKHFGKYVTFLR